MPDQAEPTDGKTYRFISDPKHKENLSGRVRAACITCRRKKIKCSGEVPCSTCREKGVVCEGLTARKRPGTKSDNRRSLDLSTHAGEASTAASPEVHDVESSNQSSPPGLSIRTNVRPNISQRPSLTKIDTVSSDSGYSSGDKSSGHGSASGMRPSFEPLSSTMMAYDISNGISQKNSESQDWTSALSRQTSNYIEPDGPQSAPVLPTSSSTKAVELNDSSAWDSSWWLDNEAPNATSPANLLSAARVLEEQAECLRRLASRHETSMIDHRRQTINIPASSHAGDPFGTGSFPPNESFDDMALMFTDRSPGKGVTTIDPGFSSYSGLDSNYSAAYIAQQPAQSEETDLHLADVPIVESAHGKWHHRNSNNTASAIAATSQRSQEHGNLDLAHSRHRQVNASEQFAFTDPFGALGPWPE